MPVWPLMQKVYWQCSARSRSAQVHPTRVSVRILVVLRTKVLLSFEYFVLAFY